MPVHNNFCIITVSDIFCYMMKGVFACFEGGILIWFGMNWCGNWTGWVTGSVKFVRFICLKGVKPCLFGLCGILDANFVHGNDVQHGMENLKGWQFPNLRLTTSSSPDRKTSSLPFQSIEDWRIQTFQDESVRQFWSFLQVTMVVGVPDVKLTSACLPKMSIWKRTLL